MKLHLHPHVQYVLRQRPGLWGILGRRLIASLGDAKVKRINEYLLNDAPEQGRRYLVISTDRRLLGDVADGFWNWLKRRFYYPTERVVAALKRFDIGFADYIVAIHEAEEPDGFESVPKHMMIYLVPTGQNMASHVENLYAKTCALTKDQVVED